MSVTNVSRRGFLKMSTLGGLGTFVFSRSSFPVSLPHALTLYVGTYTAPGKSEGIYIYQMDSLSGQLKRLSSVMSINPSYLALGNNKRHLYAVNEVGDFDGKASGAISAYAIDAAGNLKFINQQPSLGADPCYLTVDANGTSLLVANYTGGSLTVLPILRDGRLGPASDHVQHEGSSIRENQKGPHAHCIILDRSNRHALAADLGIDKVMIYRFDRQRGMLKPENEPWVSLKPGAGPRHITLHPGERYAYVINEIDSTITAFHYNGVKGSLVALQTVSTIPSDFSGHNDCADIHISRSGNFLYGSNRGHDSIVVFTINKQTGTLTYLDHTSTQGKTPRNFTIDPTGRFLLAANQNSDSIVTFRIDPITGRLKPTGHIAEIPSPVCLKFT